MRFLVSVDKIYFYLPKLTNILDNFGNNNLISFSLSIFEHKITKALVETVRIKQKLMNFDLLLVSFVRLSFFRRLKNIRKPRNYEETDDVKTMVYVCFEELDLSVFYKAIGCFELIIVSTYRHSRA